MGYYSELATEGERLTRRQETALPGATERGEGHNARIVFILHDGSQQEHYFTEQSVAAREKKRLGPMSYRFAYIQYWHHREKIWIG